MTHATDERPAQADDAVPEQEYEDHRNQDEARDDHDVHGDPEGADSPDEATVRSLLEKGPQGPQGEVAMAAAGIEVDHRAPPNRTDAHPGDAGHPDTADLVSAAIPAARVESAATAGLPTAGQPLPTASEPLLTADTEQALLGRWTDIQIGFVEDPAQSVRDADALVEDIAGAYVDAFGERRENLAAAWQKGDPGTEELRLALRSYRTFISVALPK